MGSGHLRAVYIFAVFAVSACDCGGGTEGTGRFRGGRVRPRIVNPDVRPAETAPTVPAPVEVGQLIVLPPVVRGPTQVDAYTQEQATVDVLWIVDNSGSLSNERQRLANQFSRFVQVLIDADVDFHVGVTSTDLVSTGSDQGRLRGTPAFIDRMTPDPQAVFSQAVTFPEDLNIRLEEGLAAMVRALTPPLSQGPNAGFQRDEAALAIIIVTDEDDGSLGVVGQYVRFLKSHKGPGREVNVSLSAVVGPEPDGCVAPGEEHIFGARAKAGTRYLEAARETNGLIESICSPNFAPFVEDLATTLAGLRRFFPLSAPPDDSAIQVFVDDRLIPEDPVVGWTYEPERRGISFSGAYVPPPGAEVRIEYGISL